MGKFLLVIVVFAALVYSLFWLLERRRQKKAPRPKPARPAPYKRSLGPDDDPDFLRELERRRRHAARQQPEKPAADGTPPGKPSEKPADPPVEKPTRKPADKPTRKPSDEPDRSGRDQHRPE